MEMAGGPDEKSGSEEEGGRKDDGIAAAPGRFRNSYASSPPCEMEEEEGEETPAQGRCQWNWVSRFEVV